MSQDIDLDLPDPNCDIKIKPSQRATLIRNASLFEKILTQQCTKQFSYAQIGARKTIRKIIMD